MGSTAPYICPYNDLPKDISRIQVWDNRFCETDRCVVDRDCNTKDSSNKTYSQNSYSAFGYFLDAPKNLVSWVWNFGGLTIDMSMAQFPSHVKYLTIYNADRIALPTPFLCHAVYMSFEDIKNFTGPNSWHWEMTELRLENVLGNTRQLPFIPSNLTVLKIQRNGLSNTSDLRQIPNSIEILNISENSYVELSNMTWQNMKELHMQRNDKLRRIGNISFSSSLKYLQLKGLNIANWIMDTSTYAALNVLQPERPGPNVFGEPSLVGYNYTGLAIKSDTDACIELNGEIKELWDRKLRESPYDATAYTVCVLTGKINSPTPTTTAISNIVSPGASNNDAGTTSTGLIAGVAAGVGVLIIGLLVFFCLRRKKRSSPELTYTGSATPGGNKPSEVQVNIDSLAFFRVDDTSLTLQHVLGSGAFADVWLGTYRGQSVAVKKLHETKVSPSQIQSFINEIQLMGGFESPYIVSLIGVAWSRPSDIKCILELMDSGDLRDYLELQNPETFTWDDKLKHIFSIAQGLVYLHSMNIIHRDLKSRNVLLDSKKGTKLTDFGISKEDIQATMTAGVGTFRWMAPEVIQYQTYSVAADIYAFGVLLSEFDTHRIPYSDLLNPINDQPLADTAIMVQVVSGSLKPSFFSTCPAWIRDMATQCLSTDPRLRPTATQLSYIILKMMREDSN